MSASKNATSNGDGVHHLQEVIVDRVVISPENAPVIETALVLSDAALRQLVIKAPIPASK
jgi:hypothetical protein